MQRLLLLAVPLVASLAAPSLAAPARAPEQDCAWEERVDRSLGLAAWVQRCDFGFRRIEFVASGRSLAIRYSDGGPPDPLVDVIDREPGESGEAAVRRVFAARTDPALARRCVLRRFAGGAARAGVERFTFVPDDAYARELARNADPDEVPEPPCGPWGEAPDGIQYFEVHPASAAPRILFVRVGQDTPLFDEASLRLLAPE